MSRFSLFRLAALSCLSLLGVTPEITAAPNGWRQAGYDSSKTNKSIASGPGTQPSFQTLINNPPGTLSRIAKDGSLILYDGNALSAYSATGILRWTTSVGSVSDIAISPSGTIYTSTPTSVSAWSLSTGHASWSGPYIVNTGNETNTLTVDTNGAVYIVTGASYVGVPGKVTAINENGTLKWDRQVTFRGYQHFLLSTDESLGYIMDVTTTFFGPTVLEHAVSTATGQDVYSTLSYTQIRGNTYAFAPWQILYTGGFSTPLVGCTPSLGVCTDINANGALDGIVTLTATGVAVLPGSGGIYLVIAQGGNTLWTSSEPLTAGFSDASGNVFAIASNTDDIVAFNSLTGQQLWRQHFSSPPSAVLMGDDGSLYVSVGTTLLKSGPSSTGAIQVTTNVSNSTFKITGPATYTGSGASYTQPNAPPGTYTITYGTATGYLTPASQAQTLVAGGTIAFSGTYQALPATAATAALGQPGSSRNPAPSMAEPVNTATGNYYMSATDLAVAGRGQPFVFRRSYNSADSYRGPLGIGWTQSFNLLLVQNTDGSVNIKEGDGGIIGFTPSGPGSYTATTPGVFDRLTQNGDGSFTLIRKNQTKVTFSGQGKLVSIIDRNGNAQTCSYDSLGNLTGLKDTANRSYALNYDGNGRLVLITDPIGRTVHYSYDTGGHLVSFQNATGAITAYSYDASDRLISATDPRGNVYLRNTYDGQGRVVAQTNARNLTTTFAYNTPSLGTTTTTDPLGNITRQLADGSFRLVQQVDANGGTTSYTYSAGNLPLSITDPLGRVRTLTYDVNGNTTSITDPAGKTNNFSYDAKNNLLTATDPLGRVSHFTYDANGNLLTSTDPAGNTSNYTYDSYGELLTATNKRGFTTSFQYDAAGDLVKVIDGLGGMGTIGYDGAGRITSVQNQLGNAATRSYDAANRILSATDPLGSVTQFQYDGNGNLVKITDPNGNQTLYAYDPTNKLMQVTDANGGITKYQYDGNTDLTAVIDANGHTTAYAYDALRRLAAVTDALGRTKHYAYDAVGNATATVDANSKINHFGYDAVDRLISMSLADGKTVVYSYDAVGNRLTMADWRGTTSYICDALNRVTSIATPDGKVVGYGYDAAGNRATLLYPDGRTVRYGYDALNRLTSATDWSGKTTSYAYDAAGDLLLFTHPNGASSSYQYDAAGRLLNVTNRSGASVLSAFTYVLDKVGNRVQMTTSLGGVNRYAYDPLYRLISWTAPSGQTTQWTYDAVGNRLSLAASSGATVYSYDAADELLSAGLAAFTYDANGNQITKTTGGTTLSYSWDALNRLISVVGGATNTRYQYDGDGNRVSQQVPAGTYQYANDTANPLPVVLNESGPDGNIDYAQGRSLVSATGDTFQYYYQFDGLGSAINITDATGAQKANYSYDPWGKLTLPFDPLGTKEKYKFTGETFDASNGLVFLRQRYYDPSVGRFLSQDRLAGSARTPLSRNCYQYALSNPLRFIDPSGLTAADASTSNSELGGTFISSSDDSLATDEVANGIQTFSNVAAVGIEGSFAGFTSVAYSGFAEAASDSIADIIIETPELAATFAETDLNIIRSQETEIATVAGGLTNHEYADIGGITYAVKLVKSQYLPGLSDAQISTLLELEVRKQLHRPPF